MPIDPARDGKLSSLSSVPHGLYAYYRTESPVETRPRRARRWVVLDPDYQWKWSVAIIYTTYVIVQAIFIRTLYAYDSRAVSAVE